VKAVVHGPAAGVIWDGSLRSWGVDEAVEIDDGDTAAVAWMRRGVPGGLVTITEDTADKPRRSATVRK
jgi:hypothetical protein